MEKETKNLRIHGRVHGVGYRAWAADLANRMRIVGWVRNISHDQSVEACITAYEDDVQKFITECYKGPKAAKVDIIHVIEGIDKDLDSFEIRETK